MNIYLLFNSDIMNFLLKNNGVVKEGVVVYESGVAEGLILLLSFFKVFYLLVGEMQWGWAESLV